MADPNPIDPERLAALIDGRLDGIEAAAVRAQLASAHEETVSAFADAMAIARDLDAALSGVAHVRSITSARTNWRWLVPALGVLAASLIAVTVIRLPRQRLTEANDVTAGLVAGTLGVPAWSVMRSNDAPVTERGRATRMGVLLVQFELAARAGDTAAMSRAAMIAVLLDGIPGGAAASARWTSIADNAAGSNEQARAIDAGVARSFVDPDFVRLGAWLEGARTAAAANQRNWFNANDVVPLARAMKSTSLSTDAREALAAVERATVKRPLDLVTVSAAVSAAETVLAR